MLDVEKIVDLENEIVGRLMESILNEREIPHILRTNHDSAYDGLFAYQKGWGFIEADPRYREEILEIYADVMKQQE